jgi:hypothetical protein
MPVDTRQDRSESRVRFRTDSDPEETCVLRTFDARPVITNDLRVYEPFQSNQVAIVPADGLDPAGAA